VDLDAVGLNDPAFDKECLRGGGVVGSQDHVGLVTRDGNATEHDLYAEVLRQRVQRPPWTMSSKPLPIIALECGQNSGSCSNSTTKSRAYSPPCVFLGKVAEFTVSQNGSLSGAHSISASDVEPYAVSRSELATAPVGTPGSCAQIAGGIGFARLSVPRSGVDTRGIAGD